MEPDRGLILRGFQFIQHEIDSKLTQQFQRGRSGPSRGRRPAATSKGASTKSSEAIRPLDPTLTPPDIATFRHWALGEEIQGAIEGMGITIPTPIQRLAIGPVLEGKDVIAKAETGTGKTLAFGAPMMAKIDPQRASVLGLALCPTRELAEQVMKVLAELGKPRGIQVALIVGGEPAEPQVRALKAGAQVVVGTPGRILDLYKQKFLSFPWTEFVILDEADVMFEIGFIDDVKEILSLTPDERQTLLFSATFPPELLKLARANTRDPAEVATAAGLKTVDTIEQSFIRVDDDDRGLALMRLIENSDPDDVFLVFCSRRTDVDKLFRRLERMPYSIKALHGGYDQAARFRVMSAFRTGEVKALIATDVASRGLDVLHVTTVVNFGSPQDITDYTHRIGRTGRAGRKGRAVTLVGGMDHRRWTQIQREATWQIHEAERPMRGDRPLLVRVERSTEPEPIDEHDAPRRTERSDGPQRATRAPAQARDERPRRTERPAGASGPRAMGRTSNEDLRGERAPQAERSGHVDRGPRRSWPRDEHAPIDYAAPIAAEPFQVEPRPDDPIDRRDRPLRKRPDVPQWPIDDDAPPPERPTRRDPRPVARVDVPDPRVARTGPARSDPRTDRRTQPDVERDVRPRGPDAPQRGASSSGRGPESTGRRTERAAPARDANTERAAPARDTNTERAAPARDTSAERTAPARDRDAGRAAPPRDTRTERASPARESRNERTGPAREERPARSAEPRSTLPRERTERDAPTRRSADAPRASPSRNEEPPRSAPRRTADAPPSRRPEGPAAAPSARGPRMPARDAMDEPRRETGPRRTSPPPRAPGHAPRASDRPADEPRGREHGRGR